MSSPPSRIKAEEKERRKRSVVDVGEKGGLLQPLFFFLPFFFFFFFPSFLFFSLLSRFTILVGTSCGEGKLWLACLIRPHLYIVGSEHGHLALVLFFIFFFPLPFHFLSSSDEGGGLFFRISFLYNVETRGVRRSIWRGVCFFFFFSLPCSSLSLTAWWCVLLYFIFPHSFHPLHLPPSPSSNLRYPAFFSHHIFWLSFGILQAYFFIHNILIIYLYRPDRVVSACIAIDDCGCGLAGIILVMYIAADGSIVWLYFRWPRVE